MPCYKNLLLLASGLLRTCLSRRDKIATQSLVATRLMMGRWMALAALILCMPLGGWTQSNARAQALRLSLDEQSLYVTTQVELSLPSSVDFALERGLALQFVAKAKVSSPRWYWFDRNNSEVVRRYRLSFIPLTRKWRVQIGGEHIGALSPSITFDSKASALAAMQRINQWQIARREDLKADEVYTLEFSYELDTASLPRPMQIGVIGENDWVVSVRRSVRFVPRSLD